MKKLPAYITFMENHPYCYLFIEEFKLPILYLLIQTAGLTLFDEEKQLLNYQWIFTLGVCGVTLFICIRSSHYFARILQNIDVENDLTNKTAYCQQLIDLYKGWKLRHNKVFAVINTSPTIKSHEYNDPHLLLRRFLAHNNVSLIDFLDFVRDVSRFY